MNEVDRLVRHFVKYSVVIAGHRFRADVLYVSLNGPFGVADDVVEGAMKLCQDILRALRTAG
jgi:hypothetical protein